MLLNILNRGERMSSTTKTFSQYLQEWMDKGGEKVTPAELARRIKKTPAYVHYLLKGKNPSSKNEKPIQPSLAVVDRIADALNVPQGEAREAAGWSARDAIGAGAGVDVQAERLMRYYSELPSECQEDAFALIETLWRRRRVEGRAEKIKHIPGRRDKESTPDEGTKVNSPLPARRRA